MKEESLDEYIDAVYHRCYRILRNPDLAWDALQDVFESYFQVANRQRIRTPLAYLYRASTNRCINILRRESRLLPFLEDLDGSLLDGMRIAEDRLLIADLEKHFGTENICLLVYRYVDQMTYGEIAEVVGMSDRGAKKKIERMEREMRSYLQQEAGQGI